MSKNRIILIRNAKSYDFGGGERFPIFLADILHKNGYNPLLISRSPKLLAFAKDHSLNTIRGLWWSHQNWSGKHALLFPIYLAWQIILFVWYVIVFIRHNPSVIHIQSKDDFIAATFAGRVLGKRVIWTDHADLKHIWKNTQIWHKNPVGKLVYASAQFAHTITVVSKSEQRLVSDNLPSSSKVLRKIVVVYNGVSDVATSYTPPAAEDNNSVTFTVASRLVTDKGITEIIEAFTKLSKRQPEIELNLLGDGPEADKFKRLANNHPKINFLGYQKNPLTYMAASDVFVHPTYHEGFSVALVEASMLSLPVIATSVGGNVEIIKDRTTGLLVPAKDTDALYDAMRRIASDSALRNHLGLAARKQYEERFNFDIIVTQEFIPLYKGEAA